MWSPVQVPLSRFALTPSTLSPEALPPRRPKGPSSDPAVTSATPEAEESLPAARGAPLEAAPEAASASARRSAVAAQLCQLVGARPLPSSLARMGRRKVARKEAKSKVVN